jgi:hypothetical protein
VAIGTDVANLWREEIGFWALFWIKILPKFEVSKLWKVEKDGNLRWIAARPAEWKFLQSEGLLDHFVYKECGWEMMTENRGKKSLDDLHIVWRQCPQLLRHPRVMGSESMKILWEEELRTLPLDELTQDRIK